MICEFKNVEVRDFETGEEYVDDCYGVKCDGCGELHIHSDYGCDMMTDSGEMEDDALMYGGFISAYLDGRELHFCRKCCHPVGFADSYGIFDAKCELYWAAYTGLDSTHNVKYLICDGEIVGTTIVTKEGAVKYGER